MRLSLDHCWRQLFFKWFHEIPVELEHAECIANTLCFLAIALCAAYKPAYAFADYAIEVFNICCFDIFMFWVSKHDAFHFSDELSVFSNFDKLPVINTVFAEKFWHDECIIIIAIRKYFKAVSECG